MFDRIVAIVDHDPILLTELDRATRPFIAVMEKQITDDVKREEARLKVMREMLDQLVERRLVQRVAAKKGVSVSEAEIDQAVDSVAKQNNLSKAAVLEEITKSGMTEKEYRAEIASQVLEGRLVILFAHGKIDTSDPAAAQETLARFRKEWIARLRAETFIEVRL